MPTSRFMGRAASSILIRVAERHMPGLGVLVERRRNIDAVDLEDELHRGLHLKISGPPKAAAEAFVEREDSNLVRVGLPRLAVDPVEQRAKRLLIVRIDEKIHKKRHAAPWFV